MCRGSWRFLQPFSDEVVSWLQQCLMLCGAGNRRSAELHFDEIISLDLGEELVWT